MPKIIIIRGAAGVGKTVVSKNVAKVLKGKYVSMDKIVDNKKNKLYKDKEKGMISQKSFLKANKLLLTKFNKEIKDGKILIIDGCFYWKSQIMNFKKRFGQDLLVFTLKASLKTCIRRDNKRKKPIGKDAIGAVYNASTKFDCGILIDTNKRNVYGVVGEILKSILI